MRLRRLLAVALAVTSAASLFVLAPGAPAGASSVTLRPTIAPPWGRGDLTIIRTDWTVKVGGKLTDTRADGDCVYVEAVLGVDHWTDPDGRTPDHCGGKGTSRAVNISLTPGKGSRLSTIRVRVCAADAFKDSCKEVTYGVPSERAIKPQYKAGADRYLKASMAKFKEAAKKKPAPYNWGNDGCSSPTGDAPGGFNFRDSCNRHDFGYRNYGKGSLQVAPFDSQRKVIDDRFLADMRAKCRTYAASKVAGCYGWAQTYHTAVRRAGGRAFYRNG